VSETALAALLRAIRQRASETGAPWGSRAYLSPAPQGTAYPYLVFQKQAGGEINGVRARDAEFVMLVKAIDDSLAGALAAATVISERFNDAGVYDRPAGPLDGGADWVIQTTTEEQNVFYSERLDGRLVYHSGAQYRVRMEAV
jgi:hypothetical protein